MRISKSVLIPASALFLGAVLLVRWPVDTRGLESHPRPAEDYAEAVQRVAQAQGQESDSVVAVCDATLLTHGRRTPRVFVLVHGYANCPKQFGPLAERLFAAGHNVYLPRLPGHGYANRMTAAMSAIDAPTLAGLGDHAVDVASGLGDEITVVGLSAGGVIAAWTAANRREVQRAVMLAPALGVRGAPAWALGLSVRLLTGLPDRQMWWDPRVRQDLPGPSVAYPRFSTRAVGECFRLGLAARDAAVRPGRPRQLVLVLNEAEPSLHNGVSRALAEVWKRQGVSVTVKELPEAWNLPHDFVDPAQPGARVDEVYPILLAAILGPRAEPLAPPTQAADNPVDPELPETTLFGKPPGR